MTDQTERKFYVVFEDDGEFKRGYWLTSKTYKTARKEIQEMYRHKLGDISYAKRVTLFSTVEDDISVV